MAVDQNASVKVEGLAELKKALLGIAPNLRKRALRDALRAGALVVRKAMRDQTPVLKASDPAALKGRRRPGTLKRAISVRTSRVSSRQGNVGVFVNVRPIKRGADRIRDPFYWRWVNFGYNPANFDASKQGRKQRRELNKAGSAKARAGVHFVEKGAASLRDALPEIIKRLGPAIQKLNVKRAAA